MGENEFVEDHREILGKVFGEPPPFNVTCTALGLNSVNSNRRNIISAIATKCDKFARTLKAVSSETGLPVGYLYFKCTPGRRNNENEKEKQLEISHLKVNSEHNRRGLAQALFLGVLTHLWKEDMIEYAQDMRLSVFDANLSAIALYERLGFQQLNEPWYSAIKEWTGGPPEGREIGWRRYQRIRNKPEVMEDMDQVTLLYNNRLVNKCNWVKNGENFNHSSVESIIKIFKRKEDNNNGESSKEIFKRKENNNSG